MLPFLKPKRMSSVIMARANPEGGIEPMKEEGEMDQGLMAAAEDLIRAVHAKDARHLAQALHSFVAMCDEMPHEEGPHE